MKLRIVAALLFFLLVLVARKAHAEAVYQVLQRFSVPGEEPAALPIVGPDGNLYGCTNYGGQFGAGIIYRLSPDENLTVLHSLSWSDHSSNQLCFAADGRLYGINSQGGRQEVGTIFRVAMNGESERLATMSPFQVAFPFGALLEADPGVFFGLSAGGGVNKGGTLFRFVPGSDPVVLHSFNGELDPTQQGSLIKGPDGRIYGCTNTTIFRTTTTGEFKTIFTFPYSSESPQWPLGSDVQGSLCLGSDGWLYGVTRTGGENGGGTFFRISTLGEFQVLTHFRLDFRANGNLIEGADSWFYGTSRFGADGLLFRVSVSGGFEVVQNFGEESGSQPPSGLVRAGQSLYGVAQFGGVANAGTLFRYSPGAGFAVVHQFGTGDAHSLPSGLSPGSDGALYGTMRAGGPRGHGAIVRVEPGKPAEWVHGFSAAPWENTYSPPFRTAAHAADGSIYCVAAMVGWFGPTQISKVTVDSKETVLSVYSPTDPRRKISPFVIGSDGLPYCIRTPEAGKAALARLEASGQFTDVCTWIAAAEYLTLTPGANGSFYGTYRSEGGADGEYIYRATVTGEFTKLHDFSAEEGSPTGGLRLTLGQDGALYGWCRASDRARFYRATNNGGFTIISEIPGPYSGPNIAEMAQAPDGNFYAVSNYGCLRIFKNGGYSVLDPRTWSVGVGLAKDGNVYGLGKDDQGTYLFRVEVTNSAPLAVNDRCFARLGETAEVDVLANDSEPDGQALTVSAVGPAARGTVELVGNKIRYTPSVSFKGSDAFTYTVGDGLGGSATAEVKVLNLFLTDRGRFEMILFGPNGMVAGPTGMLTCDVDRLGNMTGSLRFGGRRLPLSGSFALNGELHISISRRNRSPIEVDLKLDLLSSPASLQAAVSENPANEDEVLSGSGTAVAGMLPSNVTSRQAVLRLAPLRGPAGEGWATVRVSKRGVVRIAGKLADGSSISTSLSLQRNGSALMDYRNRTGTCKLTGPVDFTRTEDSDEDGVLSWVHLPTKSGPYRAGINAEVIAYVYENHPRPAGTFLFDYDNPQNAQIQLRLTTAEETGVSAELQISLNDRVILVPGQTGAVKLQIDRSSGTFFGTFRSDGGFPAARFSGIIALGQGWGSFVAGELAGRVDLSPRESQ